MVKYREDPPQLTVLIPFKGKLINSNSSVNAISMSSSQIFMKTVKLRGREGIARALETSCKDNLPGNVSET